MDRRECVTTGTNDDLCIKEMYKRTNVEAWILLEEMVEMYETLKIDFVLI